MKLHNTGKKERDLLKCAGLKITVSKDSYDNGKIEPADS